MTNDTGMGLAKRARDLLPERGPARLLALAVLVDTLGRGLFMSASVIFFTRSVGLSVREIGLGLGGAAAAGLLTSTPLGYLADRRGPREVLSALLAIQGLATCGFMMIHTFWAFTVLMGVTTVSGRGAAAARGALLAGLFPPERRVGVRAYLRVVTNIGISTGTIFAGLALQADTHAAYSVLIAGDAASYVVVAAMMLGLPHLPPVPAPRAGARMIALRDRPFLAYTALHGVLALHFGLFTVAVPLWVTLRTDAPRSIVSALFLINGAMVVLLQVRVSRGTEQVGRAARAHVWAGLFAAGACVLYAMSGTTAAWLTVALLAGGAFVHVLAELYQTAGSFALSFALAPDHAQGQYQGAFDMGYSVANMAGPVVATLVIGWGRPGWLLLGCVFIVAGALVPAVSRWAQASRRPSAEQPAAA